MVRTIIFLSVSAIILTGCATHWTKPGFNLQQWQMDDANCMNSASTSFPPQYSTYQAPGYTIPIKTDCYRFLNSVSCNTTGGQSYPITFTQDLNLANRQGAWERCVRLKGYFPVGERAVEGGSAPDDLTAERDALKAEEAERCQRQEFAFFYSKSACDESKMTIAQLKDNTRPTSAERKIIPAIRNEERSLEEKLVSAVFRYNKVNTMQKVDLMRSYTESMDKAYLDLSRGKLTYGQFNERRKETDELVAHEMQMLNASDN